MLPIIVIGASAGGLEPLRQIIAAQNTYCVAALFVVMHTGPHPSMLPFLLSRPRGLAVVTAVDRTPIEPGHVYVPPPDHHMRLQAGTIRVTRSPKVHFTRPAADPLFTSAAETYGRHVMGIVLSGGDGDGAIGLRAIARHGGITLVQSPEQAIVPSMPRCAIALDTPQVLSVDDIVQRVQAFCAQHTTAA